MKPKPSSAKLTAPLRAEAERRLAGNEAAATGPTDALLHELQVHQIELEMQNETLRQAQIALEESRDRYIDLYEFAPVGYLTLAENGLITEANLTVASLLGGERKRLLQRRFDAFVVAGERERWRRQFLGALAHEGASACDLTLQSDDGLVAVHLDCARSGGGDRSPALRIALTNIGERKAVEHRLEQSQAQLKTFIQHAPLSIAMFDRDMNYLATSGRWLAEYGRGHADLVGCNHYRVHPDLPAAWRGVHQQGMAGITLSNDADLWQQADGSQRWLRWALLPWHDETGMIGGIIISAEDITESRRTESELATLRSELQQVMEWQVARHTVAALAHEINQPLSSISALCEAASRMLVAGARPERLEQTLRHLAVESERVGGVVRHLLESLRQPDTRVAPVALAAMLREAVNMVRANGYNGCEVLVECADDFPAVRVNRMQVEKVLLNLIGNSIEAMRPARKPPGRVWISASLVAAGSEACITVRDEGPGIGGALEQQIFHPFVTTKSSGIGMGLAISRSLVEAQGGKLWHDAHDGPGATFRFTLPLAR